MYLKQYKSSSSSRIGWHGIRSCILCYIWNRFNKESSAWRHVVLVAKRNVMLFSSTLALSEKRFVAVIWNHIYRPDILGIAPKVPLGAMPNEFAKQKGLWWVPWPGRNELRKTSHEIITSNCQLYTLLLTFTREFVLSGILMRYKARLLSSFC